MGIVIDSNILIDLERGKLDPELYLKELEPDEEIFISIITVSELLYGVHRAITPDQKLHRSSFVEKIISNLPALPIDLHVARTHSELTYSLASSGKKIGIHDSWIAATCIANGFQLSTRDNRAFQHIPGLQLYVG